VVTVVIRPLRLKTQVTGSMSLMAMFRQRSCLSPASAQCANSGWSVRDLMGQARLNWNYFCCPGSGSEVRQALNSPKSSSKIDFSSNAVPTNQPRGVPKNSTMIRNDATNESAELGPVSTCGLFQPVVRFIKPEERASLSESPAPIATNAGSISYRTFRIRSLVGVRKVCG
jgi:hypothetical protein